MSLHVILGKPGSGKSFYATRRLIQELLETNRNIVTNLPLRLPELNAYLQVRYPTLNLRPLERIRMLTDSEVRWFWKFRCVADECPPEVDAHEAEQDERKKAVLSAWLNVWAKSPTSSDCGAGVAYFLDEAHIPFNARAWASIASAALFYLSQHRKLGDIIWVITQSPGNLDKQFRSVAEDFTRVKNEYVAKFGIFKGRGRFVRKTYLSEPTGSDNQEPFETASFELDGVEKCYDTAKGIGVHGNKADVGRRAKGIPILWVIPAFIVLGLLIGFIPWLIGKGAQRWIAGTVNDSAKPIADAVGKMTPKGALEQKRDTQVEQIKPVMSYVPSQTGAQPDRAPQPLFMRGYAVRGTMINVVLSDGRTLTEKDKELGRVERNAAMVDGKKVFKMVQQTQLAIQSGPQPQAPPATPALPQATQANPDAQKVLNSQGSYRGEQLVDFSEKPYTQPVPAEAQVSSSRRK